MENERIEIISWIRVTESDIRRNREYYNMLTNYQIEISKEDRKYRINKIARNLRIWKNELKRLHQELSKIDSES